MPSEQERLEKAQRDAQAALVAEKEKEARRKSLLIRFTRFAEARNTCPSCRADYTPTEKTADKTEFPDITVHNCRGCGFTWTSP